MIGRATYPGFSSVTQLMQQATNRLLRSQQDAAGLDRLARPSEHPADSAEVLRLDAELDSHRAMTERLTRVTTEVSTAEGLLGEASSLLVSAQELAVMMASGPRSEEERALAATDAAGLLESMYEIANTEFAGVFLFGGTAVATQPFDDTGAYQGSSSAREIPLMGSDTLVIGYTGDDVFAASGAEVFEALEDLHAALVAGDEDMVSAALTRVETAHAHVVGMRSAYGSAEARVQELTTISEDAVVSLEGFVGQLREMDAIEAFTELAQAQTVYEAAASTMGQMLSNNIFDYL